MLQKIKQHIRAYNKHLPLVFLDNQTPVILLRLCHPLDRLEFASELKNANLISEAAYKKVIIDFNKKRNDGKRRSD